MLLACMVVLVVGVVLYVALDEQIDVAWKYVCDVIARYKRSRMPSKSNEDIVKSHGFDYDIKRTMSNLYVAHKNRRK